jgi:hypothetical protein
MNDELGKGCGRKRSRPNGVTPDVCLKELQKSMKTLSQNMKSCIFWDITPRSPLNVNRRFGGTYHLHLWGRKISRGRNQGESRWQGGLLCLSQAFTSVDFQWTTRRYIPEYSALRDHSCENLKSYIGKHSSCAGRDLNRGQV